MPRRRTVGEAERLTPLIVMMMLAFLAAWLTSRRGPAPRPAPPRDSAPAGGYLFCTWNVENLFDDRDDPKDDDAGEDWFGRDPAAVHSKLDLLAEALLAQNGGRGPDILALVEVETRRSVELLRDALNARLPPDWHYNGIVHRNNRTGRRIEPAVLTRLPVVEDTANDFGIRRIVAARIMAGGAPLTVFASHWTSRLTDTDGAKRAAYAGVLSDALAERLGSDPAADILIAGDFNDEPDDPSIRDSLNATGDEARVRVGGPRPILLDVTARLARQGRGTYRYRGRWEMLDHIVASPGLLDDRGWRILPETVEIRGGRSLQIGRDDRPRRFGNRQSRVPRGPSDHFAVTVRLVVGKPPGPIARSQGASAWAACAPPSRNSSRPTSTPWPPPVWRQRTAIAFLPGRKSAFALASRATSR